MHLSAASGHFEIVKLLLEHGADVLAVNSEGQTPYQVSLAFGHGEIVDYSRSVAGTGKFEGLAASFSGSDSISDWHFNFGPQTT
jgi:ankyrin repeat protein